MTSSRKTDNTSQFFKNLLGLFRLNRFYRKTRTNILILHNKGIINLNYILFFAILTLFSTLTFYFIWTIVLFPRNTLDHKLSGFEHYPKNLLSEIEQNIDIFDRKHMHFSTVVCDDKYLKVVELIKKVSDSEIFETEGKVKKALHFHIFTRDTSFENTTMAIDNLIYPPKNEVSSTYSIKNPSNIKFHMHNSIYQDCHLMLIMSPIIIFEKSTRKQGLENEMELKYFDKLLGINIEYLEEFTANQGEKLLKIYENSNSRISKLRTKSKSSQRQPPFAYIFDPKLSTLLPDSASLDGLVNSEWRSGTDQLLDVLFKDKIFDVFF